VIAWINVAVLVASTVLVLVFYVLSVRPAALERQIGPKAYKRCTIYRFIAGLLMGLTMGNYIVYFFYPLPIPLSQTFPWPWWVSALIAVAIAIPAGYLWIRGMLDAGEETMVPKKEHTMYGGIYLKIRHPQAAGEVWYWLVFALLLHSPFLALYSLVWIPVFVLMSLAEERDLLLRYGDAYRAYMETTGFWLPKMS
jgi:protein-S-isoprenylcysteine O-methyltransferase Ste14